VKRARIPVRREEGCFFVPQPGKIPFTFKICFFRDVCEAENFRGFLRAGFTAAGADGWSPKICNKFMGVLCVSPMDFGPPIMVKLLDFQDPF
jgi:hypothetical protein